MDFVMNVADVPETLDKNQLRNLLCSGWMRHDAMWFNHCAKEMGIESANKLNRAAIKDMAQYEGRKLMEALGYKDQTPQTFEEFQVLLINMFGIITASFMKGTIEFYEENKMRFSWQNCFAYSGVARMGLIENYECGVFERVAAWLDVMGVKWEVSPNIKHCMMHEQGHCFREYTVHF